jgi:hypothetical protein
MMEFLYLISLPVVLIAIFLSLWFLFAKLLTPGTMLVYKKINPYLPKIKKPTNAISKAFDLNLEYKGLGLFLIVFATYSAITGEYGLRGPIETYLMFAVSWGIFLTQIYRIEIVDNNKLIFYKVLRKTEVKIEDVFLIVEGIRHYKIHHKRGILYIDNLIGNLTLLRNTITSINPKIKSEGISLKTFFKDWWSWGFITQFLVIQGVWLVAIYLLGSHKLKFIKAH